MNDFSAKNRGQMLKALMRNTNTAKLLRDASAAPLGSTSRQRAQKIFNIMAKIHPEMMHDGAGGPGYSTPPQQTAPTPEENLGGMGMVVFNKIPQPNIRFVLDPSKDNGPVYDGAGGPGFDFSNIQLPPANINQPSSNLAPAYKPQSNFPSLSKGVKLSNPQGWNLNTVVNQSIIKGAAASTPYNSFQTNTPSQPRPVLGATPFASQQPQTANAQTTAGAQTTANRGGFISGPTTQTIPKTPNAGASAPSGGGSSAGGSGPSTQYPNIPQIPPQPGMGDVNAAVASNMGPSMFAWNTITDPNNPLTKGVSMANAVVNLSNSLWDKYNITGLQNQAQKLQEEGVTLPNDIAAYIRGRDEYLNKTDGMINDFMGNIENMDLSNPADQQRASSYLNNMYILRGRQNSRYITFLNDSVAQHERELTAVNNMYSTALNAYQKDLTQQSAITQEQYQMYNAALTDMYNTVSEAPMKALQMQALKEQILTAQTDRALSGIKANAQNHYLADYNKLKGHVIDSKGMLAPGIDLVERINTLGSLDNTIAPDSILQAYSDGVNKLLGAKSGDEDGNGQPIDLNMKLTTAEQALKQMANLASQGKGAGDLNTYEMAAQYGSNIALTTGQVVGQYLNSGSNVDQLKSIIPFLSERSGLFNLKKPLSREGFQQKIEGSLGLPGNLSKTLSGAVYDTFTQYKAEGGDAKQFVNSLLYDTSSTSSRGGKTPLSNDQIANNIGQIYSLSIFKNTFGGL